MLRRLHFQWTSAKRLPAADALDGSVCSSEGVQTREYVLYIGVDGLLCSRQVVAPLSMQHHS